MAHAAVKVKVKVKGCELLKSRGIGFSPASQGLCGEGGAVGSKAGCRLLMAGI